MPSACEREALVERLGLARADLVQEVLLEADLGGVHPLARRRPVDVARRDLRLRDEGDAVVAEIGEADGVPGGDLRVGLLARDQRARCSRRSRSPSIRS